MAKKAADQVLSVSEPMFDTVTFTIEGTSPYCQNKFGGKAMQQMIDQQKKGSAGKSTKKREPKDFAKLGEDAKHVSDDGWIGIPCAAFRNALIDACRAAGIVMTRAKLAVTCEPDGFDATSGDPLVKITKGKPTIKNAAVRNDSGVIDIRPRPVWAPGWQANVALRFDADMITAADVANLLYRAGQQVGVGEGRNYSKKSNGMGWGMFVILEK